MAGKTSQQWWDEVKADPKKFNTWLVKQYRGEVKAAFRITAFSAVYAQDDKTRKTLKKISSQEHKHAKWVFELLQARNIIPEITVPTGGYWEATLTSIKSLETMSAVAAHAEGMRLERIRVIAEDVEAPKDVRDVFIKILKDELFHERAFRKMAGDTAMSLTRDAHIRGRNALGLVP